ncbi:MAG: hypothetical protein L0216_15745 [Planctomycetales bacterium]|nr:hypothetical protein [Planctomycetales bacterium]
MKGLFTDPRRYAPRFPAASAGPPGGEVMRVRVSALDDPTRLPFLRLAAGGSPGAAGGEVPEPAREVLARVARELRGRRDGLLLESCPSGALELVLMEGGPLGRWDPKGPRLTLAAPLVRAAADGSPGGEALLLHVVEHEWRHACAGSLYAETLGSGPAPSRPRVGRAVMAEPVAPRAASRAAAVTGGVREEALVLLDGCAEALDLGPEDREALLAFLRETAGTSDPYAGLLAGVLHDGEAGTRAAAAAADLASVLAEPLPGEPRDEELHSVVAALWERHRALDRSLRDPRLHAPPAGDAARILRGANDRLRLAALAPLAAVPGPAAAEAGPLLAAAARGLRGVPGLRERNFRSLRRLALLAAAESAARREGEAPAKASETGAVTEFVAGLLDAGGGGARGRGRGFGPLVATDLADLALARADEALSDGCVREALEGLEAAAAVCARRGAGADAGLAEDLRAAARGARERFREAEAAALRARPRADRHDRFAARAGLAARDPTALTTLLDEAASGPAGSPEDVAAVLVAADQALGGQLADTDTFAAVAERSRAAGASPALSEGIRRFRGLLALAAGKPLATEGLGLELAVEALASERLFAAAFGIEDLRGRAAIEARVHELLNERGIAEALLRRKRGLLRREWEPVPPAETRAELARRLREQRQAYAAGGRDPAQRDDLAYAEWCAGVVHVLLGDPAEAWERLHGFLALHAEKAPGEEESLVALVAALPRRGAFGDANRILQALTPVRDRLDAAVDLLESLARDAAEGRGAGAGSLTPEQREKAPAVLERWRAVRRTFPRIVRVRLGGEERETRLTEFLEVGAGGKEGQLAALRHLFLGRPFFPFLGYHRLELEEETGKIRRFVSKVGITERIAGDYAAAFRFLIPDVEREVARLRGNHLRERFVNAACRAFADHLREESRARTREGGRAQGEGRLEEAQAARREAERRRAVADALLVPEVRVAEVGGEGDAGSDSEPVPLLLSEEVPALREFPKSRFARAADESGALPRVRRQEERIAAALEVLREEAKEDLRRGNSQAPPDALERGAEEAVRLVRAHATCLTLLLANSDFQLFTSGPRMVVLDMGELILPEVFWPEGAVVGRAQTHRLDVSVVTEEDRAAEFGDVLALYQEFFGGAGPVLTAARAAGLDDETSERVVSSLAKRAQALPTALELLIRSGGTLYLGPGGHYLPRQRGTGTRYLARRPSPAGRAGAGAAPPVPRPTVAEETLSIAPEAAAAPGRGEETLTLDPAGASAPPRPGARVLVASAHEGRRAFLAAAVRAAGAEPIEAPDSDAAGAALLAGGVACALVELDLPPAGGAEVLRVAAEDAPEDVPTILLAAPEELAEAEPLLKFQPDAVVLRPLKAEEIAEALKRVRGR